MGRRWFFCRTYLDEALTCTLEVEVGMPRDLPCKFISGLKRPLLSGKFLLFFVSRRRSSSPVTLKCFEIIGKKLTFSERTRRGLQFSAGPISSQLSPFGRYLASKSIVAKTAFRKNFSKQFFAYNLQAV